MGIYAIGIVLLVAVLFFGKEVNGANAWFRIGSFGFQPAEIAKFGTALAVANILSASGASLRDRRTQITILGLLVLPILLILLQPDAGSALVFSAFLVPLYREGLNGSWYFLMFSSATLVILGLIFPPAFVIGILFLVYAVYLCFDPKLDMPALVLALLLGVSVLWWNDIFRWIVALAHKPEQSALTGQLTFLGIVLVFFFVLWYIRFRDANRKVKDGMQVNLLLISIGGGVVFLAEYMAFSVLAPHQQERIKVWLRPQECDPRGSLYNILHSKMAISSGGFSGKGFLDGNMTKLRYVPEQNTDFIFCTVSEEQGFIGVLATLVLFSLLVYRILVVAERSRSNFTRIYGYTVAGIIMVHFIVNIGMTMGLFPIIGIPLPFISYGGSSLIGFTLLIGVFLKLARGN
jgi:rod shape determining protein RodA